nr:MAG TPA_asm: hypothetical protein [Caudoviricetes sp.]
MFIYSEHSTLKTVHCQCTLDIFLFFCTISMHSISVFVIIISERRE